MRIVKEKLAPYIGSDEIRTVYIVIDEEENPLSPCFDTEEEAETWISYEEKG